MRRFSILTFITASALTLAAQSPHSSTVELLRNEKWWGIYVGSDIPQPFALPFSAPAGTADRDHFTASMMVSSSGRYIWSAYPMSFTYDGKRIRISSAHEEVMVQKGGSTLRKAYLVCSHRNMPPEGVTVPAELFGAPVYDLGAGGPYLAGRNGVIDYADKILGQGLPAGTLLIPEGWQSTAEKFAFNTEIYPRMQEMVAELHARGFKVMLTVTPFIPATGRNYISARTRGELLETREGDVALFETTSGYSACLNMASGTVAENFRNSLAALGELYAIDYFLFDWSDTLQFLDEGGRRSDFQKNWTDVVSGFRKAAYSPALGMPGNSSLNFMGSTQAPVSWNSMGKAVSRTVNAGLAGYIYSLFDPGKLDPQDTDEELTLRACQLALMMPVALLPPSFDNIRSQPYKDALAKAFELRGSMEGYLAELVAESAHTSEPLVRHLEYQFPGQGFFNCTDQYMLGAKYLVAPVLEGSDRRTVRLPRGVWTAWDGTRYRGPRVISVDVSNGQFPYFVLQGK